MRTGIFGGTFNPVHLGHLRAAEEVREMVELDRVLWVPSARPPHKEDDADDIVSPAERMEMVALAIQDNPAFELLDTEITRPGPSFTLLTLETLHRNYPDESLFFLIGVDAFVELHTWHRPADLFRHAHLTVMSRPGEDFTAVWSSPFVSRPTGDALRRFEEGGTGSLQCPCTVAEGRDLFLVQIAGLAVSSTEVRRRIRAGRSVRYLLPAPVESYILSRDLYRYHARRTEP